MDFEEQIYRGERANPACEYYKLRHPLRLLFNGFICELCKIIPSISLKNALYRLIGVNIGKDVVIAPHVQLDPFYPELITLEDGVIIGWGTAIFTHEFTQASIRRGRVHVKRRALIGGYSLIRPGVTVGENAVVAVKSYVNKNVPDDAFVGGIPIKRINRKNKNLK
jgi:acetyltransferase-like isoleucine patch superfamily enzyme